MLTKTKAVLAAALILGTASAALASDNSGEYTGGFVVPGNAAVNPVYHPRWFPNAANTANTANGGKAYGFVPATKSGPHVSQDTIEGSNYRDR
ncbi:MAG TPA: hypothetical protein VIY51_06480 [Xanthobacteraceae bacterium]